MSKDGLIGQGIRQLDLGTLLHAEQLLKDCGLEQAAAIVHRECESVKKEIDAVIKYSGGKRGVHDDQG